MAIKIKTKLIMNGGAALVILSFIGGIVYNTNDTIQHIEALNTNVKEVLVNTLQLRRVEKDFMLRASQDEVFFESGKVKYIKSFTTRIQKNAQLLSEIKKDELIVSSGFESRIESLEQSFVMYEGKFINYTNAVRERGYKSFGYVGEMRSAVHAMDDLAIDSQFKNDILVLRKHEKDYLIRKDLKYKDELGSKVEEIKLYIEDPIILSSLDDYVARFNRIVDMDEAIGFDEKSGVKGELRAAIHVVEPAVESLINAVNVASESKIRSAMNMIYIIIVLTILIGVILSVWINRSITKPLIMANHALEEIANGNLTYEIVVSSDDEVGEMMANLKSMSEKFREIILKVIQNNQHISDTSSEMTNSSQAMSEGATEQASAAEEISSSMEEMAANIQQNTDNAKQTEKIAEVASTEILSGSEAVNKTVDSMQTIANKISIIGEISRQTNLLALNAAVEAARAGEHGRGFAVVAAEVRKLAERSQVAATEIDDLSINSMNVAQKSGVLLKEIVPNIQKTSDLVQEITAASIEQNSGADQINNAIQQLNEIVQQNAATAEELAASSEELNAQSENMKELMRFFNVGTDNVGIDKLSIEQEKKIEEDVVLYVKDIEEVEIITEEVNKDIEPEEGVNIDLNSFGDRDEKDSNYEKF